MKRIVAVLLISANIFALDAVAQTELVVHEWGTITTKHATDGTPEGRLNRIAPTEILPQFVHKFEPDQTADVPERRLTKGASTPGRPDVTMRLETPVMYFYPTTGSASPTQLDVDVKFRGGVINEFYPKAEAGVQVDQERIVSKMYAGIADAWDGNALNKYVVGSLAWKNLELAQTAEGPQTTSPVWLAPRKVGSSFVKREGEAEKYLFYRGVAHLDALLQTELGETQLVLRSPKGLHWLAQESMPLKKIWIAEIQNNGSAAFRELGPLVLAKSDSGKELTRLKKFFNTEYSEVNLKKLRASMKAELQSSGLFSDEAEAMLQTWEESYFKNPGIRIFYLVPDVWLNYFLPVRISVPNKLTRVFVGRIDVMSQ